MSQGPGDLLPYETRLLTLRSSRKKKLLTPKSIQVLNTIPRIYAVTGEHNGGLRHAVVEFALSSTHNRRYRKCMDV